MRPPHEMTATTPRFGRIAAVVLALAGLAGLFFAARETGWLATITDQQKLRDLVESLGVFGPVAIVLMLALAIVLSPVPSAPIGIVAGAAYGPVLGTALTMTGSFLGAATAFLIARFLAYDAVRRWGVVRRPLTWLETGHSQNWLMAAVFLTRLAPFLSFDAISYAAGLTPLAFWRFAIATLLGVAPISFLLAYGGDTVFAAGGGNPIVAILVFGGITGIPILARVIWMKARRRENPDGAPGAADRRSRK